MQLTIPPLAIDRGTNAEPAYSAEAFRSLIGGLLTPEDTTGTIREGALSETALRVTVETDGTVYVDAGAYVVEADAAPYLCVVPSRAEIGKLSPADATNTVREFVYLRIDDPTTGGRDDRAGSIVLTSTPPVGASSYVMLAVITVPRLGAGAPSVADMRTYTAPAGAPIRFSTETILSRWSTAAVGQLAYVKATGSLYIRKRDTWRKLHEDDSDAKWTTVAPAAGFTLYGSAPLVVKVRGGVATVTGAVKPVRAGRLDDMGPILRLPTWARPTNDYPHVHLHQGSGQKTWVSRLDGSGELKPERYGSGSHEDVVTTTWLVFSITYVI